ncbi:hypothetical protein ZIOFF_071540 [Zingiber officinale]|uniref:Uncharacterized protein n=1 Tax=Zingiber officinale TaxID=94328 RepID=A0A8J5C9T3_ZINOF|nr:hypothetical protein ZIOFF_071540 [Zingiber officinale]
MKGNIGSLLDQRLAGDVNLEELERACKLACWCIQDYESCRPTMGQVLQVLEGFLEVAMPPIPRSLRLLTETPENINVNVFYQTQYVSSSQSSQSKSGASNSSHTRSNTSNSSDSKSPRVMLFHFKSEIMVAKVNPPSSGLTRFSAIQNQLVKVYTTGGHISLPDYIKAERFGS